MRRLLISFSILSLLFACAARQCAAEPQSAGGVIALQGITGFVLYPWVTLLLIFAGMMLLISQLMTSGGWGITGLAGALCLGTVVGSCILAGAAAWTGVILLLAGLGLLLVEASVLPGRGISVAGGLVCLFLGLYWTLGGASAGIFFAVSASALFTLMSFAAFLAHLPRNSAWRELSHRVEISTGGGRALASESGQAQITHTGPLEAEAKPGTSKDTTDLRKGQDESKQQTVGTGQDE